MKFGFLMCSFLNIFVRQGTKGGEKTAFSDTSRIGTIFPIQKVLNLTYRERSRQNIDD
jgi:hypothetical protein